MQIRKQIYLIPNKSFRYYNQKSSIVFRRIRIKLKFKNIFIFYDLIVTFENIYSCFEDFS